MSARALQQEYYRRTAGEYDDMHDAEGAVHAFALERTASVLERIGARSVLDTGCGTGRALRHLRDRLPGVELYGNDPSAELLEIAVEQHGIPAERLTCVGSQELPYDDGSFDAVIETAVLHHVPDPERVVAEMVRVARKAVFLSDSNIYGQGPLLARSLKLALRRAGLLRAFNRARRGGQDWFYSDGDGVGYSFSVFDALPTLRASCAEVVVVPTTGATGTGPLTSGPHCLVVGLKHPLDGIAS